MSREEDVRIDEATPADVERAANLLRGQLEDHGIELSAAALEGFLRGLLVRRDAGRLLVARSGGTTVGVAVLAFAWTLEHGGATTWLDELYVDPAQRRRGIGRRLVGAATRLAAASGCRAVDLEVEEGHAEASRLYDRLGFRRHRRTRWFLPLAGDAARAPLLPSVAEGGPRPFASLDHLSLGVNDLARSKVFYDAALAPLGLVAHEQISGEIAYGPPGAAPREGFAFYIGFEDASAKRPVAPSAGFHVALRAPTRRAVDAFYAAALASGGTGYGDPGLRPRYHASYYGAFVVDPDGHHVEAVCHAAAADLGETG